MLIWFFVLHKTFGVLCSRAQGPLLWMKQNFRKKITTQAAKVANNSRDATKQQLLRNRCRNKKKPMQHRSKKRLTEQQQKQKQRQIQKQRKQKQRQKQQKQMQKQKQKQQKKKLKKKQQKQKQQKQKQRQKQKQKKEFPKYVQKIIIPPKTLLFFRCTNLFDHLRKSNFAAMGSHLCGWTEKSSAHFHIHNHQLRQ